LERLLLVNELFVVCGIIILAYKFSLKIRLNKHDIPLIIFILYTTLFLIRIVFTDNLGTLYQIIRTLPLYYSVYAFFLGVWLAKYVTTKTKISERLKYITVLWGPGITLVSFLFFSIRKNRSQIITLLLTVMTLLIHFFSYSGGSLTIYVLSFFALFSLLFKNTQLYLLGILFKPRIFILLLISTFTLTSLVYISYNPLFSNFNPTLLGDSNVVWRITFWFNSVENLIQTNLLFGIGLGTPIVSPYDLRFEYVSNVNPSDPNIFFTIGIHNSHLAVFVRYGIIGFILYVSALYSIIGKAILRCRNDQYLWSLITSFLLLNISALFNVVLESPLYASTYWMLLGLISFRIR
jgi:hypothetical protein